MRRSVAFTREQRFADAAEFQSAFEAPDWHKIGSISAVILGILLVVGWLAAGPIQSWLNVSRLDAEQKVVLEHSLNEGSECIAGGYAEDAIYAYADALRLDASNGAGGSGVKRSMVILKRRLQPAQYREYLHSHQQEEANRVWLKTLFTDELSSLQKQ